MVKSVSTHTAEKRSRLERLKDEISRQISDMVQLEVTHRQTIELLETKHRRQIALLEAQRRDSELKQQKWEAALDYIKYPVLTLPPEVISRIFIACLSTDLYPHPSPNTAPLLASISIPRNVVRFAFILSYSAQLRRLAINLSPADVQDPLKFRPQLPLLRELKICSEDTLPGNIGIFDDLPALVELSIHYPFSISHLSIYPTLTSVTLWSATWSLSVYDEGPVCILESLSLPSLHMLDAKHMPPEFLIRFIPQASCSLRHLAVYGTDDWAKHQRMQCLDVVRSLETLDIVDGHSFLEAKPLPLRNLKVTIGCSEAAYSAVAYFLALRREITFNRNQSRALRRARYCYPRSSGTWCQDISGRSRQFCDTGRDVREHLRHLNSPRLSGAVENKTRKRKL
ncbi:hypothetical protein C8J57DRAFT_1247915 [Mycena rebaudengoi]|nr:hypothetical protein C8J57DRAFT_1247915 [Mycena rebaudengoi]